jgi:hypothetical protein
MDEDRLRNLYDEMFTHTNPHSPYYDGPDYEDEEEDEFDEEECCEHGVSLNEDCDECDPDEDAYEDETP